jgi:hypothetical protein
MFSGRQRGRLIKLKEIVIMKKISFVVLIFASAYALLAQEGEFRTETRQVNQQMSVVITGYNGTSKQIHIPAQIGGFPVVGIGDGAFRSRRIELVTLPATLVFIGDYAFYDNSLTGVSVPPSVTTVGIGAFDNNVSNKYSTSANLTPNQSTTYTRTVTIEPAHSKTAYQPKSNPPAPEKVSVIVVPGYNPMPPSMRQNGGIVTIQQYQNPPPAVNRTVPTTTPAVSQTVPATPVVTQTVPAVTANPSAQSNRAYEQSQHRVIIVPEDTADLFADRTPVANPESKEKENVLKLRLTERSSIGSYPPPH